MRSYVISGVTLIGEDAYAIEVIHEGSATVRFPYRREGQALNVPAGFLDDISYRDDDEQQRFLADLVALTGKGAVDIPVVLDDATIRPDLGMVRTSVGTWQEIQQCLAGIETLDPYELWAKIEAIQTALAEERRLVQKDEAAFEALKAAAIRRFA